MSYALSPVVEAVMTSPVTQAQAWLQGREFPAEKPLLDIAQAAPGYPPADDLNHYLAEQLRRPELSRYSGNFWHSRVYVMLWQAKCRRVTVALLMRSRSQSQQAVNQGFLYGKYRRLRHQVTRSCWPCRIILTIRCG